MKKAISLITALMLFTAIFSGCQVTPEKPVVIQKDMEQMIEKAQQTPENAVLSMTLREQYGIPDTLSFTDTGAEGKLVITVDALVSAPDVSAMPIVRVAARDFTQEEVSLFYTEFCGDTAMYTYTDTRTKAEIETLILNAKQEIPILEASVDPDDTALAQYYTDAYIPSLEEMYADAPVEHANELSDGMLDIMEINGPDGKLIGTYRGLDVCENPGSGFAKASGARFIVRNNSDLHESVIFEANPEGYAGMPKVTGAVMAYFAQGNKYSALETVLPDNAEARVGLTKEGAERMVSVFLEKKALPFAISSVGFIESYPDASAPCCYAIHCNRRVSGVDCAAIKGASYLGDSAMTESWAYEAMSFLVDADGIAGMQWSSPLDIKEVSVEDSALLPFEEIDGIFEKMMRICYEPEAREDIYEQLHYNISSVRLELVRVIEQNSIEYGLLVPAWRFYGRLEKTYAEGVVPDGDPECEECILTINAIDGSVIDLDKGY